MTKKASMDKVGEFRKWVMQNASKYDPNDRNGFFNVCVTKFNVSRRRVKDCIAFMRREGEIPKNAFLPIKKEVDVEPKVEAGLRELGSKIIKDEDFRTELAISRDKWRSVVRLSQFKDNRCEIKGKRFRGFYWGNTEVVKDLKHKIELI